MTVLVFGAGLRSPEDATGLLSPQAFLDLTTATRAHKLGTLLVLSMGLLTSAVLPLPFLALEDPTTVQSDHGCP